MSHLNELLKLVEHSLASTAGKDHSCLVKNAVFSLSTICTPPTVWQFARFHYRADSNLRNPVNPYPSQVRSSTLNKMQEMVCWNMEEAERDNDSPIVLHLPLSRVASWKVLRG
jgi:hypothetical protein